MGLHWQQVDFEHKELHVRYGVQKIGATLRIAEPKTESALRTIPLSDIALEALDKQRKRIESKRLRKGERWEDQDLVFPTHDGGIMDPSVLHNSFKYWLKRHRFPDINVHMMRHIAATYLMSQGVAVNVVQRILGHSAPTITMTVYGYALTEFKKKAVEHFDCLYEEE
ncbi:MAG TPA: site-specific integrase [Ktedonosporobacter sp.]|nr:site-specific integrase [Ktedonosporobacter sp.]